MTALTDAMIEAYAYTKTNVRIYETIELNHATFSSPIYLISGVEDDMTLPTAEGGGSSKLFKASAVNVILPGSSEDGPTPARITLDNVSGLLIEPLNGAMASDQPITVVYRAYSSEDLTKPGDIIGGLELWDVTVDVATATGTLRYRELELQAFPLATYDETYYPAIQDAS
jgi:hypothetical protein